jgi:hypothetical protein
VRDARKEFLEYMENKQIIYFSEMHPEMTLREFADSLKEKEEETRKKEQIRRDNEKKWFEDLIGKYVSINHNGDAYTVLYVDKTPGYGLSTKYDVFNVYRSKNKFSIEKEKRREINKLWFKCPYSEPSYGGEHSSMKIITKEEYEEIEKTYNEYKTQGELLNL